MPKITQLNNINTNRVLTNDFRSRNIKNLSNRLTLDNIIVRNLSTYQKKPNIIRKSRFYDKNSRDTFSQLLFILQNGMDLTIFGYGENTINCCIESIDTFFKQTFIF